MGLRFIPQEVLQRSSLLRLRLDFNDRLDITSGDGIPSELMRLKLLSLRACNIHRLPENVKSGPYQEFPKYENADPSSQEDQHLEVGGESARGSSCLIHAPKNSGRARYDRNFTVGGNFISIAIDLSKNRMQQLPRGFESLDGLKSLNLASNYIKRLSLELSRLSVLHTLILDNNLLGDIPASISELKALRTLNISRNNLVDLPMGLKKLSLESFRLDHNRIEFFDDDLFSEELGKSLKYFSCNDNNILRLPQSLTKLSSDIKFFADSNPLTSPPAALLAYGFALVQQYMWNRELRIQDLFRLLEENGFELDEDGIGPNAYEVLIDGTELLHPEDLLEFDRAVDEFINGEYYLVSLRFKLSSHT